MCLFVCENASQYVYVGDKCPLKPCYKGVAPPLTTASGGQRPLKPLLFQEAMQSGLLCVCLRVKMHHNMWEGKDSCTMGEGGAVKVADLYML